MLEGIKILDFTSTLPGPHSTMILADMGAEVLRIEHPDHGDLINLLPPRDGEKSGLYNYLNRNKKVIKLDLKKEEEHNYLLSLLDDYNVIVEGFRPGVMNRLGLGYEDLKTDYPNLIYLSLTGYGQTGPMSNHAGHDINFLAMSGITSILGMEKLQVPGLQLADTAGGALYAVIGLLGTIIERKRTGKGQFVDVSMRDCVQTLSAIHLPQALVADQEIDLSTNVITGGSYYDYYETADGKYLAIGPLEEKFYIEFCEFIGIDPSPNRLSDPSVRAEIEQVIKSKDLSEWQDLISHPELCVDPVLTLKESLNHPQSVARNSVVAVDGTRKQLAHPIKYSDFSPKYSLPKYP